MEILSKHIKSILQEKGRLVLVNQCTTSATKEKKDPASDGPQESTPRVSCSSSIQAGLVTQSESLVTLLLLVLSDGLWPGLDLWSVLVSLERCQNLPPPMAMHCRFAVQMVLLIRTSFVSASEGVKSRAFIRCALNQGCLLAALEILARQFQPILEGYMMDHALLRQYGTDRWDRLVRVIAPIAGPPFDVFYTIGGGGGGDASTSVGADTSRSPSRHPSSAIVFDLGLVVPELDAHKQYMSTVRLYIGGVTDVSTLPELPIDVVEEPEEHLGDKMDCELEERQKSTSSPTASPTTPPCLDDGEHPAVLNPPQENVVVEDDGTLPSAAAPQAVGRKKTTVVKKVVVTKRVVKKGGSAAGGSTVVTTTRSTSVAPPSEGPAAESSGSPDVDEPAVGVLDARETAALSEPPPPPQQVHADPEVMIDAPNYSHDETTVKDVEAIRKANDFESALVIAEAMFARRRAALSAALETIAVTEAFIDKELDGMR